MGDIAVYLIPLILVLVVGFLAGKRQQFSTFCKELGEALLETSIYIQLDKPTEADTARFKKEWQDVFVAGGGLLQKILHKAKQLKR